MKTLLYLVLLFMSALATYPQYDHRRYPQRAVMFGGYYGRPMDTRSYIPEGSMTFAAGDTIATNSFVGDQAPYDVQTSEEETTEQRRTSAYEEELEVDRTTSKPKRVPKRKPSEEEEDSEEDDSSSWPFSGPRGRNGAPSYNAFFPIMFGGLPAYGRKGGSGSSSDGFYPGSATAIANSFSTGKGGVATSHATSFGDPYLSTLFRNGSFNKKGAKPQLEK